MMSDERKDESIGWVIIADGEGSGAYVIRDKQPHEQIHKFMCFCGKPWQECETDDIRATIDKIDDEDNWVFGEGGGKHSMELMVHECGKVWLYVLTEEQSYDDNAEALRKMQSDLASTRGALSTLVEGGKDLALQISGLLEEREKMRAAVRRIDDTAQFIGEDCFAGSLNRSRASDIRMECDALLAAKAVSRTGKGEY